MKSYTIVMMSKGVSSLLGCLMLPLLAVIPETGYTQTLTNTSEQLGDVLHVGQTVIVRDEAGRQTTGKVEAIADESFTLLTWEQGKQLQKSFGRSPVTMHWEKDGLWNGALIGLAAGGLALGVGSSASCASSGCGDWGSTLTFAIGALFGGGVGAGVGALIDRAHPVRKLHLDYRPSKAAVRVSPLVGRGTGVLMSVSF